MHNLTFAILKNSHRVMNVHGRRVDMFKVIDRGIRVTTSTSEFF